MIHRQHPLTAAQLQTRQRVVDVIFLGVAFFFIFVAYGVVQTLASSVLPPTIAYALLGTLYVSFGLCNLLVAAPIVNSLGTRPSLFLASLTYTLLEVANVIAVTNDGNQPLQAGVLIPASILIGAGASVLWTAQGTYVSRLATSSTQGKFAGIFFSITSTASTLGPLIASGLFAAQFPLPKAFGILTTIGCMAPIVLLRTWILRPEPVQAFDENEAIDQDVFAEEEELAAVSGEDSPPRDTETHVFSIDDSDQSHNGNDHVTEDGIVPEADAKQKVAKPQSHPKVNSTRVEILESRAVGDDVESIGNTKPTSPPYTTSWLARTKLTFKFIIDPTMLLLAPLFYLVALEQVYSSSAFPLLVNTGNKPVDLSHKLYLAAAGGFSGSLTAYFIGPVTDKYGAPVVLGINIVLHCGVMAFIWFGDVMNNLGKLFPASMILGIVDAMLMNVINRLLPKLFPSTVTRPNAFAGYRFHGSLSNGLGYLLAKGILDPTSFMPRLHIWAPLMWTMIIVSYATVFTALQWDKSKTETAKSNESHNQAAAVVETESAAVAAPPTTTTGATAKEESSNSLELAAADSSEALVAD